MAIEITPEIKQAVLDQLCVEQQHFFYIQVVATTAPNTVTSGEPDKMPFISCQRCGRVWVIAPDSKGDYDAAEETVINALTDQTELKTRLIAMRNRRKGL